MNLANMIEHCQKKGRAMEILNYMEKAKTFRYG